MTLCPTVGERLHRLFQRQDWYEALSLIDQHWLDVWYSIPPSTLAPLLNQAPSILLARFPGARVMHDLTVGRLQDSHHSLDRLAESATSTEHQLMRIAAVCTYRRFTGRPLEALNAATDFGPLLRALENPVADTSRGLVPAGYLQLGLTAMLAGRPTMASAMLTRAQDAENDERFGFVARDASFKLAVLHAACGETIDGVRWLGHGHRIPASDSWTETSVSRTADIARQIMSTDLGEDFGCQAEGLSVFGEMWPYLMFARVRHALFEKDIDRAERLIAEAELSNLIGTSGDGVFAAAIPLSRANTFLAQGRVNEAREAIADSPRHLASTQIARARVNYMSGNLDRVIDDEEAAATASAHGFLRPRVEFTALLAASYVMRGLPDNARDLLRTVLLGRSRLPPTLLRTIPIELLNYAQVHWRGDPDLVALTHDAEATQASTLYAPVVHAVSLTRREREILASLLAGRSREEIAALHHISTNTVKTHLRHLYQKLGAKDRDEAMHIGLSLGIQPDQAPR